MTNVNSERAQSEITELAKEILNAQSDAEREEAARAMAACLSHYGVNVND